MRMFLFYPLGWWRIPTKSSTAREEATGASPGRVTVHCWSNVRFDVDWVKRKIVESLSLPWTWT